MRFKTSALRAASASFRKYGLTAGFRDCFGRWARNNCPAPDVREFECLITENHEPELQVENERPLRINWLVPTVGGGSGGLSTIFRTVRQLEIWGHKQRIYAIGGNSTDAIAERSLIQRHFSPIDAEVDLFNGTTSDSDALIATSWRTAYLARSIGNTVRKFYFVQDLEHLFYPAGSLSEFARQTYRWNFYGITAGQWIANQLQEEFGMQCSAFGFSYDRDRYSHIGDRRFPEEGRKRVLFYARATTERRGFELGVLALSIVASKEPETEFVLIGLPQRNMQLPFRSINFETVPAAQLSAIYRCCQVALVLSHTNLSLLPLELMACGCAVVSNSGPNVEWLLNSDSATLAQPTPESLASAILGLLRDEQVRANKVAAGFALAESTSWPAEIRKVEQALCRGLNLPIMARPCGYDAKRDDCE